MIVRVLFLLLLLLAAAPARAEHLPQNPSGEVQFRGNYWRDRNTRILNPMVDVRRELPSGGALGAAYGLDAITSASVAAGASTDQPFTELRHDLSVRAELPLGRGSKHRLIGSYGYSTESDYWSHNAGLRLKLSLARDNTTLLLGFDYGHNTAGRRMGPNRYLTGPFPFMLPDLCGTSGADVEAKPFAERERCRGRMHLFHGVVLASQVLSPTMIGTLSYELTGQVGFMNNPYRRAVLADQTMPIENLPTTRVRHVVAGTLRKLFATSSALVPHLILRPGLRLHADSWGLKVLQPELAGHLPVGPLELRVLYAFYGQLGAWFYDQPLTKNPDNQEPLVVTDTKLGTYISHTTELTLRLRLSVIPGLRDVRLFGERRLEDAVIEGTFGAWIVGGGPGNQFGIPFASDDPSAPSGCSLRCGAFYAALGLAIPL